MTTKDHEIDRLQKLISRSVRVEVDGDGCRFIVGEDHVVAEWTGDGVYDDTVLVEEPALTYLRTTTPVDRCVRMVLEMIHWEVASAMLAGPGDGDLVPYTKAAADEIIPMGDTPKKPKVTVTHNKDVVIEMPCPYFGLYDEVGGICLYLDYSIDVYCPYYATPGRICPLEGPGVTLRLVSDDDGL
jgi:hypothetical protein